MALPLLAQRPRLRAGRSALGLHVLDGGLVELPVPPGEVEPQGGGQDDAGGGEGDVGDVGLPVPRALALGVEVRGVDGGQVGPGVDDGVRDGALRRRPRQRRRHPRQDAPERPVHRHHQEGRRVPGRHAHRRRRDDEPHAAQHLRPHDVDPPLPRLVAVPRVQDPQDRREHVRRRREQQRLRLRVPERADDGREEVDESARNHLLALPAPELREDEKGGFTYAAAVLRPSCINQIR